VIDPTPLTPSPAQAVPYGPHVVIFPAKLVGAVPPQPALRELTSPQPSASAPSPLQTGKV